MLVFGAARLSRAHLLKRIAAAGLTAALAVTVASLGGPAAADPATSRNLALNRAVVHSAAKNYGETGHRATDGLYTVVDPADPRTEPNYSAIDGVAENAFDGDVSTVWSTTTIPGWIDVDLPATQTVTSYQVNANVLDFFGFVWPMNYPVAWDLKGSVDGVSYAVVDSQADQSAWTTTGTVYTIATPGAYQYYRLDVSVAAPPFWGPAVLDIAELQLFGAGGETFIPPAKEQVKWSAPASAAQSITVDLGVPSDFSHITCQWEAKNYATEYSIDVSANGSSWTTVYSTTAGDGYTDEIALPTPATGQRYVRLDVTASSGTEYALQEIEVWGDNDLSYELPAVPVASPDGTQYLSGGNWRLARASEVALGGADLSSEAGAAASAQWVPATVPGTALTSYLNAGAIVDPDFSDNQLQISDTFFTADWWYTNHFPIPVDNKSKRTWLNFDAINWKANVYFNGTRLGPRQGVSPSRYDIEGAYTPAQFEVTDLVNYGGENYLAVFIKKNDTPGAVTQQDLVNAGGNGGALGADNPTIHASIGWDWVPTIRGRDIGIYESVFLSYSGDVRIENPWVITDLDLESGDLSSASLTIKTELRNPTANGQNVVVSGVLKSPVDARGDAIVGIDPIPFTSTSLYVPPRSTAEVLVDAINVADPQLWWPNGYGDQPLYTVELTARTAPNVVADKASFKTGIREYSYATVPDSLGAGLNVSINGVRVVARGGNWGMSDANMAATAEDFDLKMRLHADENFNMVRNWVGMTGHPAFYDAADKYGIMIWDDFWLANPVDGPNPTDEAMFEASAIAKIKRVRSHAALALYCGRNEGSPPATIDAYLRTWTRELDGTRTYVSDSASSEEGTGGHGPYGVRDPSWYYINTPAWNGYNSSANGAKNLSSERGQLNIPTLESMRRMLGENIPWPPNDLWGLHDFTTGGATEAGVSLAHIENTYDPDYVAHGVEEYVATAQLMNYDNHKGMFEPVYVNDTPGLLMWMSQSAWPSMAWQTYDYYYDLNAGYYGTKKANQPINAIYNVTDEQVYLSNETVDRLPNATVTVEVWGLDGAKKSTQSVTVDAAIGAQDPVLTVSRPEGLAGERFIRTSVADATGAVLGTNFYWTNPDVVSVWPEGSKTNRGTNTPTTWADHKALRDTLKGTSAAPVAPVNLDIEAWPQAGAEPGWEGVGVRLSNPTDRPALLARVKGIDEDGAQILPFIMDDNYVTLMPGETITLSAQYQVSGRQGDLTRIGIDGYNVAAATADLGSSPAGLTDSLSRLVAAAEILPQGITSDATWAAFTGALAEARGVLALASPSQLAVDQAASALRWAIAGLELPAPADVRRLAAAVATARNLNATQYDPASWGAVAAAIMAAEAVLSQPYPVQDAADAA
ncbi:MAG: discoidin domain-containing protein, partial [Bifidobacteriaceae bacterium]|nr:discoidin domain-containing protein [Bifidobacteriaceae bacterium]